MSEVAFFHKLSETQIPGDFIENHNPLRFGLLHSAVGSANAMIAPNGSTPRNFGGRFFDVTRLVRTWMKS